MSRYIDADKLCDGRVSNDPVVIAAKCAPEEDVAPVVHARWYYHYRLKKFVCLNCGFEQRRKPNFKFCPQCSAKMDEEKRNDSAISKSALCGGARGRAEKD